MERKTLPKNLPSSKELINNVSIIRQDMLKYLGDFSRICHSVPGYNFTEYSVLYYDLNYFLQKDLIENRRYSLQTVYNFRNSFLALYSKVDTRHLPLHTPLSNFLNVSYLHFELWFIRELEKYDAKKAAN